MEDKIVYVPVSVEDELPKKDAKYFCLEELSDITPKFYCWYNTEVKRFHNGSVRLKITHWLKPTPLSELLKEKDEHEFIKFVDRLVENNKIDSVTAGVIKKYIPRHE